MSEVDPKKAKKDKQITVSLGGPLTFWIGLIVIAVVIQLVAIPFATSYGHGSFNSYLNSFATYVLYLPGIVALPLITALWVGDRISSVDKKKSTIAVKGLINAIYCILIYAIAIFIVYLLELMQKLAPLGTMSTLTFVEYMIAAPGVIVLVIVPLFALLSAARHFSEEKA